MLPAGAAETYCEIAFALVNVMGQKVNEQIGNAADEFLGLRKGTNVFSNAGIASGERTKFGNKVRIGQEADVEDEVRFFGNSVAIAEAHAGDQNSLLI